MATSTVGDSSHEGEWNVVITRRTHKAAQKAAKLEAQEAVAANSIKPDQPTFIRPHKRDHVFTAARNTVIKYNRQSLAHFTDPLRLEARTSNATLYSNGESNEVECAIVYHKQTENFRFKLVRITGAKGRVNILMCLNGDGDTWTPFEDSLAGRPAPKGQIRSGKRAYEQQQAWWSKNGKTFDLLGLPAELRDAVYEQVLPQDIYPDSPFHPFGTGSESRMHQHELHRKYDSTHKIVPKPELALTGVCRQVKNEVERFLNIETTKCFREWGDLERYMETLSDPTKFNNFSHVELDLSHYGYIRLFHINMEPFPRIKGWHGRVLAEGVAATLKSLPHIKCLTLRFTSPFDAMITDPWGFTGKYRDVIFAYLDWYLDWRGNRDRDGFTTSCQKTIVDWILTWAKEYIEHIPEIRLAGAIKTSTKLKWDMIFKDEKEGKHHDMTAEKELISQNDGPPPCNCTTPCEYEPYRDVNHVDVCRGCGYCRQISVGRNKYHVHRLKKYQFDFDD